MLPNCPAYSAKFQSAQAELGQNLSQPNPTLRPNCTEATWPWAGAVWTSPVPAVASVSRHVVCSQQGIFMPTFRRFEVTESGEGRTGNSAEDPRWRAEYRLEVGTEMKSERDKLE